MVADSVEGIGAAWTEQGSRMTTLVISGLLLLGAVTLFRRLDSGLVVSMVVLVGAGLYAVVAGPSTSSCTVLGTPL